MKTIYLLLCFLASYFFCSLYAQCICNSDGITDGCLGLYTYSCVDPTKVISACTCSDSIDCINQYLPTCPPSLPSPTKRGCIAAHQTVVTHDNAVKMIKNLVLGEKVLTENGFQDYIGNIHIGDVYPTKIIFTEDGNNIELTYDHFIKTENGFVHAHEIIVGDVIMTRYGKSKAIKTTNSTSYVMSPFTRSGTIIVNNVVLSCYATDRSHYLANIAFIPVRAGMTDNVESYFDTLLYIFDKLPMWAKPYISTQIVNKSA